MNDLTILALDCSSTTIGVCYDGQIVPTIHLKSPDIFQRCIQAKRAIREVIGNHQDNVDLVIMEAPASRFKGALIPQCRVQGAVGTYLTELGIAIQELSPQAAKMMLTGKGNADKGMMIAATMTRLPHIGKPDEHQADAYALWLCGKHLNVTREE